MVLAKKLLFKDLATGGFKLLIESRAKFVYTSSGFVKIMVFKPTFP